MNNDNNINISLEQATKLAEDYLHCDGNRVIVQIKENNDFGIFLLGYQMLYNMVEEIQLQ